MSDDQLPIVDNEQHSPSASRRGPQDNELDPEPTGCGASACCNPNSGFHRFLALIFMCLLGFGKYVIAEIFCFVFLKKHVILYIFNIDKKTFLNYV